MSRTTDYAQTHDARRNREAKARALAACAVGLGLQAYELTLPAQGRGTLADDARRERVRKDAGYKTRPSIDTWRAALDVLEATARERAGATSCSMCGAAVLTVKQSSGGRVEIDPFAHPAGTIWPKADGDQVVAVYITGTTTPPEGVPLFRQHSKSCPETRQAADRRRREAPRCTSCGQPRDGHVALMEPRYTTHPNCQEGEPR